MRSRATAEQDGGNKEQDGFGNFHRSFALDLRPTTAFTGAKPANEAPLVERPVQGMVGHPFHPL